MVMRGGGYGLIGDIIVGVVGALIGGFLAATPLKIPDAVNGINVTSILVAFVGALILIGILRLFSGRRHQEFEPFALPSVIRDLSFSGGTYV